MYSTVFFAVASLMSTISTVVPSDASFFAHPPPIPLAPPVTIAVLLLNFFIDFPKITFIFVFNNSTMNLNYFEYGQQ